jgi:predicted methyltransferase
MDIAVALARGQAILRYVNSIALEDIPIVCKIMLDTAGASYPERAIIFRKMLENDGVITVKELVDDTEYPQVILIEEIEKLSHMGLINYFADEISFTEEYSELALSLQPYVLQPLIQEQGNG